MTRKAPLFIFFIVFLLLGLVLAIPVYAGNWATIGIVEMPEELFAGRPFTIEFMVWQHGNKPVHELTWDNYSKVTVEPVLSFGSEEAGQKLMFEAEPARKTGLFTAEITLPEPGEYVWSIAPRPIKSVTEFEPLIVRPADEAPAGRIAWGPAAAGSGSLLCRWLPQYFC